MPRGYVHRGVLNFRILSSTTHARQPHQPADWERLASTDMSDGHIDILDRYWTAVPPVPDMYVRQVFQEHAIRGWLCQSPLMSHWLAQKEYV